MTERTSADRELAFQRERDELAARQQGRRESDNTKLREQRLKALEDAKTAIAEKHRAAAEATLKAELRRAYLANPVATESDFEAAFPTLRKEFLAAEAVLAPEREKMALKRNFEYRF